MYKDQLTGTFVDDEFNQPFDDADVVVFGVGYDGTASYGKGTKWGPKSILLASHQLEYEVPGTNITLNERVKICNKGVWYFDADPSEMIAASTKECQQAIDQDKFLLLLGGEHSVTNAALNAIAKKYDPEDVTIVQFDAHLDLRDEFEGTKQSHACVMKRAVDKGFNVVAVGIRDHVSAEEKQIVQDKNILVFWCPTQPNTAGEAIIQDGKLSNQQLQALAKSITTKYCYITFDVDCFDSSVLPGTGTPLPNGMTFPGVQVALRTVVDHCKHNNIALLGMDVVEVAPLMNKDAEDYDPQKTLTTVSEMNAAITAFNVLCWWFGDRFD